MGALQDQLEHSVNYWTTSSEQEQEEPHDEPSSASVASTNHPCLDLLPRVAAPGERRVLPSIASMYPLEQGIADYGRVPPGQLPGIDSLCGARFDLVARQVRTFAHAPLLSGNPERDAPFTFIPLVVPQRPADCPAFSSPPSSFGALRALNSQPRASLRRPTANEVEIQGSNATPWGMSRNELGQHELGNSPAAASVNNSGASSDAPLSRLSSIEDAATRPFPHTGSPSAQPSGSADQAMPTVSITRPPWLEELKKSDGTFYFEPLRNPNKNFSINVINAIEYFYNHEQVRTPTELCKRMPQITPGAAYEALERQARKSAETVHISKIRAEVDAKWASRLAQIGELKEHRAWKKEVQHYIGELNDSGLSPSRIAENNLLALNVKQVEHILQTRLRNEIVTPVLSRITQAPWHDWQEGDVFAVRGSDDVYQYFKVTRTRRAAELVGPNDFSPLQAQRDSDAPRRKRARR